MGYLGFHDSQQVLMHSGFATLLCMKAKQGFVLLIFLNENEILRPIGRVSLTPNLLMPTSEN